MPEKSKWSILRTVAQTGESGYVEGHKVNKAQADYLLEAYDRLSPHRQEQLSTLPYLNMVRAIQAADGQMPVVGVIVIG